jgi:hypothetical protein
MPPDVPQNQSALPRGRVVEVIARSTDDALRQLRAAGIPETEALLVIQRFTLFSVQVIRELDQRIPHGNHVSRLLENNGTCV